MRYFGQNWPEEWDWEGPTVHKEVPAKKRRLSEARWKSRKIEPRIFVPHAAFPRTEET